MKTLGKIIGAAMIGSFAVLGLAVVIFFLILGGGAK